MANEYRVTKGNAANSQPKGLRKLGNKELKITWSDDHESVYSFRSLRQNCQCALCVDEWSGKPILARESVPQNLEGLKVNLVGQYALDIQFTDGHATGIYPFDLLRKICPCSQCASANAAQEEKTYLDKNDLRTRS